MANTIKTNLTFFYLDMGNEEHARIYAEKVQPALNATGFPAWRNEMRYYTANPSGWKFLDKMKAAVGHVVNTYGLVTRGIELETDHLFDNQWNSAPIGDALPQGARLFNNVAYVFENKSIKCGYWLDQTTEMREVLRNTHKCGWCGAQEPAAKGYTFCPHCLGSEYLEKKDLHLARMAAVCNSDKARAPLTDAEAANLLPQWKDAQLHGRTARDKARIAKQRADIAEDLARTTRKAQTEHDGKLWLLDNGLKIDNVIYYDHKNTWCFGWRTKVAPEFLSDILAVISEFPFPYEILCADGRTLSGNIG